MMLSPRVKFSEATRAQPFRAGMDDAPNATLAMDCWTDHDAEDSMAHRAAVL